MILREALVALAGGVVLAALLIAAVSWLARRYLLFRRLSLTLYVAALASGLKLVSLFGVFPPGFDRAVSAVLVFLAGLAFLQVFGVWYFRIHLHGRGVRLPKLLPAVVMGSAYLLAAVIALKVVLGERFDIGPVLATSAITSLVVGLALQPILGNFFSGLVISLEKPFRLNDWIRFGEIEGRVVGINWRTTYLRTRDNDDLVIPNGKIADEGIVNFHYPLPLHLERVYVGVHYRHPPHQVRQVLTAAMGSIEGVLATPEPEVYVNAFSDSAIEYEVRIWLEDFADKPRIVSDARVRIWEALRRRGFVIPFPIRTLEIEPRAARLEISRAAGRAEAAAGEAVPGAQLFVARGRDHGLAVRFADELVVGRTAGCGLVLNEEMVSKRHARISWDADAGQYLLEDLGSTHGTRVNGRPQRRALLRNFDRIHLGDCELVFELDGGA